MLYMNDELLSALFNGADARIQEYICTASLSKRKQRLYYIARFIAFGKISSAALELSLNAVGIDYIYNIIIEEIIECAVKEPAVMQDGLHEFIPIGGIGDIAPSLAGQKQLLPRLFVALDDLRAAATASGKCTG